MECKHYFASRCLAKTNSFLHRLKDTSIVSVLLNVSSWTKSDLQVVQNTGNVEKSWIISRNFSFLILENKELQKELESWTRHTRVKFFFLKAIQFTPIQGEEGVLTTEPQVRNSEAYLQTLVVCFNSRKWWSDISALKDIPDIICSRISTGLKKIIKLTSVTWLFLLSNFRFALISKRWHKCSNNSCIHVWYSNGDYLFTGSCD